MSQQGGLCISTSCTPAWCRS